MRTSDKTRILFLLVVSALATEYFRPCSAAVEGVGYSVLTEGSVWRVYCVWMPAVQRTEQGLKPLQIWGAPSQSSAYPSADWTKVEFDDSNWMLWREFHEHHTLKVAKRNFSNPKPEDLEDTGIRQYDLDQYGAMRSPFVGLRCFRGKFMVENPTIAGELTLNVEFRGGIRAFINGEEILRAFMPSGEIDYDTPAEDYPEEAHVKPDGNSWSNGHANHSMPTDPELIKRYNSRIRNASVRIPSAKLRKGLNVLALEIHRAPHHSKAKNYSNCGLVALELNSTGKGISKAGRPSGFQVCAVNPLTKITPWGCYWSGRITQGARGYFCMSSLSWAPLSDTGKHIRMVGARNMVALGQTFVSSDGPIKNLKVKLDDLIHTDGQQRIPASQIYVRYERYPDEFPERDVGGMLNREPAFSYLDILLDKVPEVIPVVQSKKGPPATWRDWKSYCEYAGCGSWHDGGVVVPIWIFVKIPVNVKPGHYNGRVTISAESSPVQQLPISLAVSKWVAPDPQNISIHVGAVHSPDTLSIHYKTPLWSEQHWKLVETTLSYMGALGSKVLWLPLVADFAWFHNSESLVYWVKQADGSYKLDFRVFDKYVDLVQKYMKPDVVCLCILDGGGYSVLDVASGNIERAPMPPYNSSPQALDFWKPLLEQTLARLEKRGLDSEKIVVGLLWEGASAMGGRDAGFKKESMELFKSLLSDLKLAQIAHYGANRTWKLHDVPIGYTMSVWGNKTGVKIKPFHAHELPVKVAWHPRCDNYNDIRPISARGSFLTAIERSARECLGLGPVGMDFWNLDEIPKGRGPRSRGSLEGCLAWNLSMSHETCAALLAPGHDGPVPTVRFELVRLGLYEAEARVIIERTLQLEGKNKKLPPELIAKCKDVLARREQAMSYVCAGEGSIQGEGWKWFEASGWQDRTYELFECVADIVQAVGTR